MDSLGADYNELHGVESDLYALLLNRDSDDDEPMTPLEVHLNENDDHSNASMDPYQSCSPSHQKPVSSPAKIAASVP